jgi:hypothetical protein
VAVATTSLDAQLLRVVFLSVFIEMKKSFYNRDFEVPCRVVKPGVEPSKIIAFCLGEMRCPRGQNLFGK